MAERSTRIYVLEIEGRPILAFPAVSQRDAQQLTKEAWMKDDLSELKSHGVPLWTEGLLMSTRMADDNERNAFEAGEKEAKADDELTLVYLVEVDQ